MFQTILNTNQPRHLLTLGIIIYRILLDLVYVFYVSPEFEYTGFVTDYTFFSYSSSFIILILLFQLTPMKAEKPSEMIYQFMFLFIFVPLSSFYALAGMDIIWLFYMAFFWFTSAIILKTSINLSFLPQFHCSIKGIVLSITLLIVLFFILFFSYVDFTFNIDLLNVYEIRAQNPTKQIPMIGYTLNWFSGILIPFGILFSWFAFKTKINYALIIFVTLLFVLFSTTGHKTFLFSIPMLFGSIFLLQKNQFSLRLFFVLITLVGISLFFSVALNNDMISTFLVRRTLFIPAQISYYYYDFFTNNPLYLSNSIFKSFIEYPYTIDSAHLIGKNYFGKVEMSANNGIISDGYMHFGIVGIFIWSVLFSLLLKLTDFITNNKPLILLFPILLLSFKTFIDGALLTGLLTHGVLVSLIICYIYPSHRQTN